MKKFILGIGIVSITSIVLFSILFSHESEIDTLLVEKNYPLINKETKKIDQELINNLPINTDTLVVKSQQLINNSPPKKIKSDFDIFLESEVFKSTQKLDNGFISSENIISRKSVETVFGNGDYSKIIEAVYLLEKDSISLEREDALRNHLFDLIGNKYHSENYSCNGKLCFIELTYLSSEVTEEQLSNISDFGSNYAFSSFSPTTNDEMIYRGLYIATDDPSTMSMSIQ